MADFDELENEDSGVYGAILDLRMGPLSKLEVEWVGVGPHAHNVERAKANLAACRTALKKVSCVLGTQGKRDVPITVDEMEASQCACRQHVGGTTSKGRER